MIRFSGCYYRFPVFLTLFLVLAGGLLIFGEMREPGSPRQVLIEGPLVEGQRQQLRQLVQGETQGRWSLRQLHQRLVAVDWVAEAKIQYLFGRRVHIQVLPHVPVARWNRSSYLNSAGEVFQSDYVDDQGMPILFGPMDAVDEVMARYRKVSSMLAPLGQEVHGFGRDTAGRWSLLTRDGVNVQLGQEDIPERLDRYRLVVKHLRRAGSQHLLATVDTRYGNGVSVTWREDLESEASMNTGPQTDGLSWQQDPETVGVPGPQSVKESADLIPF